MTYDLSKRISVVTADFRTMMRQPEKGLMGALYQFITDAEARIKVTPAPHRATLAKRAADLYLEFLGLKSGEFSENFEVTERDSRIAKAKAFAQVLGLDTMALQLAAIDEGLDHTIFELPESGVFDVNRHTNRPDLG
ncbi:MAG: hypothetical protein ACK4VI_03670 [Alphaproteobacteria bacterium]